LARKKTIIGLIERGENTTFWYEIGIFASQTEKLFFTSRNFFEKYFRLKKKVATRKNTKSRSGSVYLKEFLDCNMLDLY
jgi:hypothetical protein